MLFWKTAERKSCSALRCAALRKSTGMEAESKNDWPYMFLNCMTYALNSMWKSNTKSSEIQRVAWRVYDICIEFDVKIQQQIIRNPTGVVEGFQERSGRAPGAKTDGKKPKPANRVPKCNPNRQEMQSKSKGCQNRTENNTRIIENIPCEKKRKIELKWSARHTPLGTKWDPCVIINR